MKIENNLNPLLKNDVINNADLRNKISSATPEAMASPTDNPNDVVQLSDQSRRIARSQELAYGAPEVREDKVQGIKSQLAAGTYNVSGQAVADALLRRSLTEV